MKRNGHPPPEGKTEMDSVQETRKRKRQQILVSCNLCRQRHVKCDGARPVCTPCQSRGGAAECVFDTEADGETRHASVKRENKALKARVSALERGLQHICEMPRDQALQLLTRIRNTENPMSTLAALPMGSPATSMERDASRAVLPAMHTSLEHELMVTSPLTYQSIEPINTPRLVHEIPGDPFSLEPFRRLRQIANTSVPREGLVGLELPATKPVLKGPESPPEYYDSRLKRLNVPYWTRVPAPTEFVARALSRYVYTYHSFPSSFDVDLFIQDLVTKKHTYCSPLLMNAVLYTACLGYSSVDPLASYFRPLFRAEAERLWELESGDSVLGISACYALITAYIWDIQEEPADRMFAEGQEMVRRVDLFCIGNEAKRNFANLPRLKARAHSYTAWGVFNFTTIRSFYYRSDPPAQMPSCPVPGEDWRIPEGPSTSFDNTFSAWCHLWILMHELAVVYAKDPSAPLIEHCTLAFAERKYREILEWSHRLSAPVQHDQGAMCRHIILRMYLHSSIMDIFRPFLDLHLSLTSFTSSDATPEAVFVASLNQLKHLALLFYSNYPEASYFCYWEHACLYIANAAVRNTTDPDWKFFFLLSLEGLMGLVAEYPFTRMIFTSLLSMVVSRGQMPIVKAKELYDQMVAIATEPDKSRLLSNGKIIVDQHAAMAGERAAQMDVLADDFTFKMA